LDRLLVVNAVVVGVSSDADVFVVVVVVVVVVVFVVVGAVVVVVVVVVAVVCDGDAGVGDVAVSPAGRVWKSCKRGEWRLEFSWRDKMDFFLSALVCDKVWQRVINVSYWREME